MKIYDVKSLISEKIGTMIDQYREKDPNGIHVIFVGNSGTNKEIMRPWIMAHRIGHAVIKMMVAEVNITRTVMSLGKCLKFCLKK
jgi:hypothetical protein